MNKEIKAVVFDMDGVILDSESISKKSWFMAGKEYGLSDQDVENIFLKATGCNNYDSELYFMEMFGKDFDYKAFHSRCYYYFDQIAQKDGIPLLKNVVECLSYLKSKYRIALASSTTKDRVFAQLKAVNVFDYFEVLLTGDMVKHSKPDPEIYLKACQALGLKPENCAAVEDSPNGLKSAYSAGLACIMVPDQIAPDEEIRKLLWHELKDLGEMKNIL